MTDSRAAVRDRPATDRRPARRTGARRHLVVLLRRPQVGVGKRRLARGAGELAAWRFQRAMLTRLLARLARDPRWTTWLAVTPDAAARDTGWLPRFARGRVRLLPQGGGDLGVRMARPMHALPAGPVVLVGSDVPGIGAAQVAQAFEALRRAPAAIGPADDGGYWLIGLAPRARSTPPFAGVRWSGPHARADTCRNLARAGRRWIALEALSDVDAPADLARQRGLPTPAHHRPVDASVRPG
jgi:rSAM/selenodomain-associated transferase 1